MNRNKVLTTILALITLGFVGLMAILVRQPSSNVINQTVNPKAQVEAPKKLINLELSPSVMEVVANQSFDITLTYSNIVTPIVASDLIVNFDPQALKYEKTTLLTNEYINPRNLGGEMGLIISFVESNTATVTGSLPMAKITFTALKPGKTKIAPKINSGKNSSMVIISGKQENQLTSVNEVIVNIK